MELLDEVGTDFNDRVRLCGVSMATSSPVD
jgi:hypothetical protein